MGIASILVPFPYAVDDHQTSNAKFLSDKDAAVLLPQNELTPQGLAQLLIEFTREKTIGNGNEGTRTGKAGCY